MPSLISIAAAALLCAVFAASAAGKLRDRAAFAASLRDLGFIPAVTAVAWSVPLAEGAAAAGAAAAPLAPAAWVPWAAAALALGLLAAFTAVIAYAVAKGSRARCNCFGRQGAPFAPRHLVRNALLMLAAAGLAAAPAAPLRPSPEALVAAGGGLIAAIVVIAWDDLAELFKPAPARPAAKG